MLCRGKLIGRAFRFAVPLRQQMSTESNEVIFETVKDKGVITMNRPKRLNSYSFSMLEKVTQQLNVWDKEASLVIIKGAGGKAFCAGADIRYLSKMAQNRDPIFIKFMTTEYRLHALIYSLKVPYISFQNGIVMGSGGGVSVNGRYRVATENTVYAMPETGIGIIPDGAITYHFPRMKNNFGNFLGLTGTRLRGMDAFNAGIATHTCDSRRLQELEDELLKCDVSSSADIEDILNKYTQETEFGKTQPSKFEAVMEKISFAFGAETVEEIVDRLKRDESEWAKETLKTLDSMCPKSLKITLRQLKEGRNKSLLEALILEYRICTRLCFEYNFFEGVRAAVIDKDRNPRWQPSSLEDVSDEMVDSYFQPLPDGQELTDAFVRVFMQYNTPLPSSAAVERLFSMASDVLRAKRSSLTAENFENLLFLKGNMDLIESHMAKIVLVP